MNVGLALIKCPSPKCIQFTSRMLFLIRLNCWFNQDNDISIRRQALDLLFTMCDSSNSKVIVSELMEYLNGADVTMREELSLKIAILAEKFATDLSWYVICISLLSLLSICTWYMYISKWQKLQRLIKFFKNIS